MVTLWRATWRARPATKPVEACAGAVGHAQLGDRRLHRSGSDVDDASELARDHAVDHGFDQHDGRDHVAVHGFHPGRLVPFAEIPPRRAAGVVHQDVRIGACREHPGAALRGGDVGRHGGHLAPGRRADLGGGRFGEPLAVRELITRSTPFLASDIAQAFPSPLLAAHTIALLPLIPRSMVCVRSVPLIDTSRRAAGRVLSERPAPARFSQRVWNRLARLRLRPTRRCTMSAHSRRLSLLSELHLATVNITASLAKRIPAPTHVGSGHPRHLPSFAASL